MNRTMITATNTMAQLQLKMDMISTNMANMETTGYKRKESYFNELIVQNFNNQNRDNKEFGRLTPNGIRQGTGARVGLVKLVLSQGALKTTNRDLDVALTKDDLFFKVRVVENNRDEIQYTRDGAFYLSPSAQGQNQFNLVTSSGHHVVDEWNQPIVIRGNVNKFTFSENGTLRAEMANGTAQTFELGMVSVKNPQYLEHKRGNVLGLADNFEELGITENDIFTELTGGLRENISLRQGALEASNVDLSKEMTDLVSVQRQYQLQARSITLADQMLGLVNGVR